MSEQQHLISFEESVKQRLTGIVAELIPPERLEILTKQAIAEYEKELRNIIRQELEKKFRADVIALLNEKSEIFNSMYSDFGLNEPSEFIKKLIEDMAPQLLANFMAGMVQSSLEVFKNQIINNSLRVY